MHFIAREKTVVLATTIATFSFSFPTNKILPSKYYSPHVFVEREEYNTSENR